VGARSGKSGLPDDRRDALIVARAAGLGYSGAMSTTGEVDGVTLERFAWVSATLAGLTDEAAIAAKVAEAGFSQDRWQVVQATWSARLHANGGANELYQAYARHFRDALATLCADRASLSFDDYVESTVEMQRGHALPAIASTLGCSVATLLLSGYEWMDRLEVDPKLKTYFALRVQRRFAEKTGAAPKPQLRFLPGQLVRRRQCHRCGAMKVTPPRTAFVYCDYCATLFDYDPWIVVQDPRALDEAAVDGALRAVTTEEVTAAFRAKDVQTYGRLIRWRHEVMMEVCPEGFSPRIRDPEYRRRMLDEVIVPEVIATRFDDRRRELFHRATRADEAAQEARSRPSLLHALDAQRALWERDAELLEAAGVFARHPDEVDAGRYLYMSASVWVRAWLGVVGEAEGYALLDAAGVATEYAEVEPPPLSDLGCGQCGAQHLVPSGAERRVCESCGHTLDVAGKTVACGSCGASIALPAQPSTTLSHACSYCDAQIAL
jgi:hypothetical protein